MGANDRKQNADETKRNNRKPRTTKKGTFGDWEIVNITVPAQDMKILKETEPDGDKLLEFMEVWEDSGHKFSSKFSFKQSAYIVSCSGVDEECVNFQKTITSFGPTHAQALMVLAYKLEVVLQGQAWANPSEDGEHWG